MIKRRNLDPSLINWIANFSGLGPGIGRVVHVVPTDSPIYSWLKEDLKIDSNDLFADPWAAYTSLVASRNDVVLIHPGTFTIGTEIEWAKAQTHMMGVGNPTWRQGGKIRVQSTDTTFATTVSVDASGVFMGGFNITQNGAKAGNLVGLRIGSTYFSGRNLDIRCFLQAAISAIELASCLEFEDGSSMGFGSTFLDCNFGTGSGAVRTGITAGSSNGVINFAADSQLGSPAAYTHFKGCSLNSRAEDTDAVMVRVADGRWGHDRYVWFDDCLFFNFDEGNNLTLDNVFYFKVSTRGSGTIILSNCTSYGCGEWNTQEVGHIQASMPVVATGGGLTVVQSTVTGS